MAKSEPSKSDTIANLTSSIASLRRLEWRVRQSVESVLSGEYKSSFRGKGMEFDQVVRYEFGDDVRDIDWNVTARLGEPYRKKFVEEREITLMLLFEDSPSLQFGSGAKSKRETLLELASLIMLLSAVNGDRISLMYASPEGFDFSKSANGRGRIIHTAATLMAKPEPDLLGTSEAKIPWKYITKAAPRHSIFVWLGDFPAQAKPDAWNVIRRRYQPIGFRIEDPWERQLPKKGKYEVFDPTSGELFTLNGKSSAQRAAHANWVEQRDTHFHGLFPDRSSRLTLEAGSDTLSAVVEFFHKRMRSFARI